MHRPIFPAVLERGAKNTFGAWFPDFPDCVAGGRSPEQAIEKAQVALRQAVYALAENEKPLPEPTPFEAIVLPKGCDFVAYFAVAAEPPDPSERVNVYLPKSLIARADARALELGMSRSSFFGFALSAALGAFGGSGPLSMALPASSRKASAAARATKKAPRKRRRP